MLLGVWYECAKYSKGLRKTHIRADILFSYLLLFLCMYIIYHGAFPLTASYCENSRDRQPGATILYLFFPIPFFWKIAHCTKHKAQGTSEHSLLISYCVYYLLFLCNFQPARFLLRVLKGNNSCFKYIAM